MANLSASTAGRTKIPLPWSGRYLFDAPVSVGHDFGIEIDGFRPSGI